MTELRIDYKHRGNLAADFCKELFLMYGKWCMKHNLDFDYFDKNNVFILQVLSGGEQLIGEHGVHRKVFTPENQVSKKLRYTVFCPVDVVGQTPQDPLERNVIRTYVLDPYKRVKDYQTDLETDKVEEVLNGNLELIWPKQ